ncbi:MerR family transcriptional regulator [Nocardioides aquaticus]|uniref:MerR family transcriptional regulator n=1 Tax=Nocardioides aquaticus TaxID=160826 RepID=UPI001BD20412|nr:MerR family transcriptional regulator [Nocardioides aquaticus]
MISDPPAEADLSIGDLATATGVGAATLRAWERRHGFPVPHRLPSGHRRYDQAQVDAVLDVVRRQHEGVRLEAAIAATLVHAHGRDGHRRVVPGERSVFAALRRRHPQLTPQRLGKPMLLALSWAIEDEFCSRALAPHLFGSFQHDSYFRAARRRWDDLALGARTAAVFADFDGGRTWCPCAGRSGCISTPAPRCCASGPWSATTTTCRPCSPRGSCPASST